MWRALADACLAILLAPRCAACEAMLERPTEGPVCAACWSAVRRLTPPLCETCAAPLASWRIASLQAARCARCRRRPGAVDRALAVGPYDGALRAIIHAFKYDGRRSLARPLALLLAAAGRELLGRADLVVPVPLHASRLRARGFNQAAELARRLQVPVAEALQRVWRTPPQTGLPAARRNRNVRNAFAIRPRWTHVGGARLVLVDDVATTGATLDACARVLKRAGAAEVGALTLARVASPPRQ